MIVYNNNNNEDDDDDTMVFVYGSLKRGFRLFDSKVVKAVLTDSISGTLYSAMGYGFPFCKVDPDSPNEVSGEVHIVPNKYVTEWLDLVEAGYNRKRVTTKGGRVCYVYSFDDLDDYREGTFTKIESGVWLG